MAKIAFTVPTAAAPVALPVGAGLGEGIVETVPLDKIHTFPNHPFLVLENADLQQLADSIRDHGVQEPVTLRLANHGYELLSGHRRCRAAELAGLTSVPAIIRPMTDDEATVYMVDANLHRPHILPSEKAKSYRMKMDALRHQGKRIGGESAESWSANQIAQDAGESSRQVYRYVRLSKLIDRFLEMVDNKEQKVTPNPNDMVFVMPMNVALTLADLTEEQQYLLFDCICRTGKVPTLSQSMDIHEGAKNDALTDDYISSVLNGKEKKAEEPPFAQSFVDAALLSWYSALLEKSYKTKPKAEFVKSVTREYRHCSSSAPVLSIWTSIHGASDGLYIRAQGKEMRLTWTRVANRIGELIEREKYISPYDRKKSDSNPAPTSENTASESDSKLCDTVSQSDLQTENLTEKPLRQLRNKKEREAFLENYEQWGVWKEIPELRVQFYKYDLPNGARIIAQTYVHPPVSYYKHRTEEYIVAEYALIVPEGDDFHGAYGQEYTYYRPNGASKTVIIEYLTTKKPLVRFEPNGGEET